MISPVSDRSTGRAKILLTSHPCSPNIIMLSIPQSPVKVSATEGTGEATLFQFDGTLETEIESRELPSLNSAIPPTHIFWSLFSISA